MATQCPECGGAKNVHVAKYDRTKIPPHERGNDKWIAQQTLSATNQTACRVCGGKGAL